MKSEIDSNGLRNYAIVVKVDGKISVFQNQLYKDIHELRADIRSQGYKIIWTGYQSDYDFWNNSGTDIEIESIKIVPLRKGIIRKNKKRK